MSREPRSIVELLIQQTASRRGFMESRRYPAEFRRDLARLIETGETSVERVSTILGLARATVRRWVRQAARAEPQ